MSTHLAWNETDRRFLNEILNHWASKGFEGELDVANVEYGFISITTRNWAPDDGSFVRMELHKLIGEKGFFGRKTNWVVRLFSCASYEGAFPVMHGCVCASSTFLALDRAALDAGNGFMSASRLEDYFNN